MVTISKEIKFSLYYFFELKTEENDKAPLFKSWTGWYVLVLLVLLGLIVLFYFFTKKFH